MKAGSESVSSGGENAPREIGGEELLDFMVNSINFSEFRDIQEGLKLSDEEKEAGLRGAAESWSTEAKQDCIMAVLQSSHGDKYRDRLNQFLEEENLVMAALDDDEEGSEGENESSEEVGGDEVIDADDGAEEDVKNDTETAEDQEKEKQISLFKKIGQKAIRALEAVKGFTKRALATAAAIGVGVGSVLGVMGGSGSLDKKGGKSLPKDIDPIVAEQNYVEQLPSEKAYMALTGDGGGDSSLTGEKDAGRTTESKESKEAVDETDDLRGYYANEDGTAPAVGGRQHNFANGTELFADKSTDEALDIIEDEYSQMLHARGAMLWQLAQQGMRVPGYRDGMGMTAYAEAIAGDEDLMHETSEFVHKILDDDKTKIEEMVLPSGRYYNEYLSWENADRCLTHEDVELFQYPTHENGTAVYKITVDGGYEIFIKKVCTQVVSEIPSPDTPTVTTTVFETTTTPETTTTTVTTTTTTSTTPETTTSTTPSETTTTTTSTTPETTTSTTTSTETTTTTTSTTPETTTSTTTTSTTPETTTTTTSTTPETTTSTTPTTTTSTETTTSTSTTPETTTSTSTSTSTSTETTTTQTTTTPRVTETTVQSSLGTTATTSATTETTTTTTNAPKDRNFYDDWGTAEPTYTQTYVAPNTGETTYTTTVPVDPVSGDTTDANGGDTNADYRDPNQAEADRKAAEDAAKREAEAAAAGGEPPVNPNDGSKTGTGDGGMDVDILSGIFG